MGFEIAFKEYVSQVESFVETMHSGLSALTETESNQTLTASIKATLKTPKKILVVDDLEINRVLFGRYFQGLPFEITFARNPDEAEQKLASGQSFDLVLRDWKSLLAQGLPKQAIIEQIIARV